MATKLTRRRFVRNSITVAGGLLLLPDSRSFLVMRPTTRSCRTGGLSGQGPWFVDTRHNMSNVVSLCDVNDC